jgi:pyridoxamine 5'-phosphate oxidase
LKLCAVHLYVGFTSNPSKKCMNKSVTNIYGLNPFSIFNAWLDDAKRGEPHDPEVACLATAGKDGLPSARMVLVKDINEKGFRFHTNTQSHKGRDLADNPQAGLCFYWKSLRKQVRAEGKVVPIDEAEVDAYFATRSRARQIGAWASDQSRPFFTQDELDMRIQEAEAQFAGVHDIPRPAYWGGYRLVPDRFEFWIAHQDRVHTRFEYVRGEKGWDAHWVFP